jgi:hypothetical protein
MITQTGGIRLAGTTQQDLSGTGSFARLFLDNSARSKTSE